MESAELELLLVRRNQETEAIESCMGAIEVEISCLKLEIDLLLESRGWFRWQLDGML